MPRWWDVTVVVLTFLSLGVVALDLASTGGTTRAWVLGWVDFGFCLLLLTDFFVRLSKANRRWTFFRRNWIDFVSSIPLTGPMRAARLLRVARLLRLVMLTRRLRRRFEIPFSTRAVGYLGIVIAILWTITGSAFYHFEGGINPRIKDIGDGMWWAMVTLSTVGYGEVTPATTGGRGVAIITMIFGIGILGSFAATLASAFIEVQQRRLRGLGRVWMKGHLLILGWNNKSAMAIEDFRLDPRFEDARVVVVAEREQTPSADSNVRFIRGSPGHREILERAGAKNAAAAIVFATDINDPRSDHETALTVISLRRINPELRISAELLEPANREHLTAAGCDSVVNGRAIASTLLVRSVQDIGVSEVVAELLTNKYGSEIYRLAIESHFAGRAYRELAVALLEQTCTVVGLARGEKVLVNPSPDLVIEEQDEAFVIAEQPPR